MARSGLLISMLEKLSLFCLIGLIALVLLMWKMDGSVLEERSSFKMLELSFFCKLDWGSYIICIAETVSKKIGNLIHSMKFSLQRLLWVSINLPYCLEWHTSCLGWYSWLLLGNIREATKTQICRTVGPPFVAILETLDHCWNVVSCRYYYVRCLSELSELVPLPDSCWSCTCYSDIAVTIHISSKYVYVKNLLPHPAKIRNCLSMECFPLTYDLNGFKSRIKRNFLSVGSIVYLYVLSFICLNSVLIFSSSSSVVVTSCPVLAVQPCMEWIPIK